MPGWIPAKHYFSFVCPSCFLAWSRLDKPNSEKLKSVAYPVQTAARSNTRGECLRESLCSICIRLVPPKQVMQ